MKFTKRFKKLSHCGSYGIIRIAFVVQNVPFRQHASFKPIALLVRCTTTAAGLRPPRLHLEPALVLRSFVTINLVQSRHFHPFPGNSCHKDLWSVFRYRVINTVFSSVLYVSCCALLFSLIFVALRARKTRMFFRPPGTVEVLFLTAGTLRSYIFELLRRSS